MTVRMRIVMSTYKNQSTEYFSILPLVHSFHCILLAKFHICLLFNSLSLNWTAIISQINYGFGRENTT